jgi:molybdopterin-guanine dinucleotide biosynthesis protein A
MPDGMEGVLRLPDAPGAQGPMAGILSAMRWAPHASWLVAACDLPRLCPAALQWLLSTRAPGVWATLPKLPGRSGVEPLLAHYDFRARVLLEDLLAAGDFGLHRVSESQKVITPSPDASLADAWTNVNTPAEL